MNFCIFLVLGYQTINKKEKMKKLCYLLLSVIFLGSVNLTLGGCSQLNKENREETLNKVCPKLNDCKEKLEDVKKKMKK